MTDPAVGAPPASELRELPSRFALPLIGDTLAFVQNPGGLLQRRALALGRVFKIHAFGFPVACLVGPEAFALLLDDRNVVRTNAMPAHMQEILNPQAIPFLDGEAHRRRKRLLMQAFRESALDGYLPTIDLVFRRYIERWTKRGTFAWAPELNALGFSIAAALFVGADPSEDDRAIEEAFGKVAEGLLSLPVPLPMTRYGKGLKARDFLLGIIDRALDDPEHSTAGGTNVLARLREARDGDERLSREELRIETFHFFGAYAAVIGGLSLLAAALAQFPDVAEKARAEIQRELGDVPLTIGALRKLAYVDRVTKEARRWTPVLPLTFIGRVTRELSFDGVRIPAGVRAVGCIGATLLDPATFADPTQFDPDRWLHATEREERAWIPHGGGEHTEGHRCAGEALANLMLKVFAVRTLRECSWQVEPGQDFSPTTGKLFATPAGGLRVQLRLRA